MDKLIGECLGILGQYDDTIHAVHAGWAFAKSDGHCDAETTGMAENLLIAVLLDKSAAMLPRGEEEQKAILEAAEGLDDVVSALPQLTPLLMTALVGHAVAMSQTRWGWIPWQAVRNAILDSKEEQS